MKKSFFNDNPAAGAVFALILSIVSGFCFANLACLGEGFFEALGGVFYEHSPLWLCIFGAIAIFQLGIAIYCLILFLSFFFRQDRSRWKIFVWGILAAQLAVFLIAAETGEDSVLLFGGMLTVVGFNALCIKKHNYYWFIAQTLLQLASLPGVVIFFDLGNSFGTLWEETEISQIPAALRVALVYGGVAAFAGSVYCSCKLWASANGLQLRDVWGRSCNVLMVIMGATFVIALTAALHEQEKCNAATTALEENFQRKISADALSEIYFRNRKTDEKFHSALEKAWTEFAGEEDQIFNLIISEGATLDKLPEKYRQKFSSPQAKAYGKFFDAPLPARPRKYESGRLCAMLLPELQLMRQSARFFSWQIRLACETRDHDRMMQAWRRSGMAAEYLQHDTFLIATLVLIAVEQIRLDALEMMLAGNMLSDSELAEIQHDLRRSAARMPEINRNALYFEAVNGNDAVCGIADGTLVDGTAVGAEGVTHYRFLVPGLWYLAARSYHDLIVRYNVKNLCKINEKMTMSFKNILSGMLMPALRTSGERMHEIEMRYRSFVVLIEAEKIKRKTGSYPESLPVEATDYFSGKPLRYKVGTHQKKEFYLKQEKQPYGSIGSGFYDTLESREKRVQGVAVWSIGRNRLNDNGISGTKGKNDSRTDDQRALLYTAVL